MHKSIEHKNKHNRQKIGEIPKSIIGKNLSIIDLNLMQYAGSITLKWVWITLRGHGLLTAPIAPSDTYGWYTETFKMYLYVGLGKHGRFKRSSNKCVPC